MNSKLVEVCYKGDLNALKVLLKTSDSRIIERVLSNACFNGKIEIAKYLIELGTNIHSNDNAPLRFSSRSGHLELVKILIKKGADIHADNNYALRWASIYNHLEIIKFLVEKGANINVCAENHKSMINMIINDKKREVSSSLLNQTNMYEDVIGIVNKYVNVY